MTKQATSKLTRYLCNPCYQRSHGEKLVVRNINREDPRSFDQISCRFPRAENEHTGGPAGTFAVLCPECGSHMDASKRTINASISDSACESLCARATSSRCSCSCGGMRHGIAG